MVEQLRASFLALELIYVEAAKYRLPCFFLPQGDLMTVLGSLLNRCSQAIFYDIPHEQTLLTSYDGINTLPLDWYVNEDEPLKKKMIVLQL